MIEGIIEGQACYSMGDEETREWFHKQWKIWPTRADSKLTTNISFHYGAIKAYRIENGNEDPAISNEFMPHILYLDKCMELEKD